MILVIQLLALVLLLGLAGFFAASETALLSISQVMARRLVDEKKKRAEALLHLFDHRSMSLGTILLLTLVTQLTATSIAGTLAYKYFHGVGTALATAGMTLIIFIYAEVAPKNYAVIHSEKVALVVANPINKMTAVLRPIIIALTWLANLSGRALGLRSTREGPLMTEEEILTAMEIGEDEGVIEEEEKKMIHHIFEFGDTVVREIMTPRPDMISLPVTASTKEALDVILKEGHSRVPVYKGTIDDVVGMLYARDILQMISEGKSAESLRALIRPAIIVPETKRVSELLRELQKQKIHMVIVVDEHGSTAGLATIEDLLEEIVGEIYDEYDMEEQLVEQVDADSVRVDGRVTIDDINETLGLELDNEDVDTVGGLMLELFGHIPKRGERTSYQDLDFRIDKIEGNRVARVLITRTTRSKDKREQGE